MALLSKAAILAAKDLKHEDVDVPEWGGAVRIQQMTGATAEEFAKSAADGRFSITRYVAACMVDKNGDRLFSDAEVEEMGRKNAAVIQRLFKVAQRLNNDTASVEDVAKN